MPATTIKRVGLYCRCSTKDQHPENQLIDLRRYCQARNWQIVAEFMESASGVKDDRPKLRELLLLAKTSKIDIFLCWRFDRVSRSLTHLISLLEELRSLGVDFVSFNESIDTISPTGKLLFQIIAALGAFERSVLIERVHAGLRRARLQGRTLRRPTVEFDIEKAKTLRAQGLN